MRLGINAIRLCRAFTGVGRYMECVLNEWAHTDVPFDQIILFTHTPLRQEELAFPLERYSQAVVGRRLPDPLWEATALRSRAADCDVLFAPSYTIPFRWKGKVVVTNLGPAENKRFGYQWWRSQAYEALYRYSARRADRVLACSHAVKQRLVDVYGIAKHKIGVTYLAASDKFRPLDDEAAVAARRAHVPGDEPLILFVGKMARRHCIPNLLEAFARLKKETTLPHRLVLVGPDYIPIDVSGLARRLGVGEWVTHIEFVTHSNLPSLYNAAELFVFPVTEAEGFGIPVVEAMACGVPVITTNQGSIREVAPGAALLTETNAPEEWCQAMRRL
ncbi:MAG: glycosyltransferase family 4 protein, partial [Planctomycetota bacterium]